MVPLIQLLAYGVVYITYVSQMGRCILIYSGSGAPGKGAGSFLRGNDPHGYARPVAVPRDRTGRETGNWIACNKIQCTICVGPASARDAQLKGDENMVESAECASSHSFTDYLENSRDYAELATFGMMRANTLLLLQILWRHPYYTYKRPPKKTFGTLYFSRRHREERYARPVCGSRDRSGREIGEKKEGVMNSYGSEGPRKGPRNMLDPPTTGPGALQWMRTRMESILERMVPMVPIPTPDEIPAQSQGERPVSGSSARDRSG